MEEFDYTPLLTGLLVGMPGLYLIVRETRSLNRESFEWKKFFKIIIGRNYRINKSVSFRSWPTNIYLIVAIIALSLCIYFGEYIDNTPQLYRAVYFFFGCASFLGLFIGFMPVRICADDRYLYIIGVGFVSSIDISDIETINVVENPNPSRCKLGSFGLFGYWGYWEDDVHGRFRAHFGRHDQRFFVRLKDGRGYMLGCKDHRKVVDFIQSRHIEFEKQAETKAWASQFRNIMNTAESSPEKANAPLENLPDYSFKKVEEMFDNIEKFFRELDETLCEGSTNSPSEEAKKSPEKSPFSK